MDTSFPPALHQRLDTGLDALGLDRALAAPLLDYLALLLRWNRTYNLTAIRDPDAMVTRHLLDSLAMHPYVQPGALADLGTGPGLPGIPLAIAKPELQVTLVESNGKKARFLREAVRQLKLGNARVAESRAEALAEPGAYTQITARAGHPGRDRGRGWPPAGPARPPAGDEGHPSGRRDRRAAAGLDRAGRPRPGRPRTGRRASSGRGGPGGVKPA